MARSLTFFGPATVDGEADIWIQRMRLQFRFNQIYALVVLVFGTVLAFTIVDTWWSLLFLGALAADVVLVQVFLARLTADNFVTTGIVLTAALWVLGIVLAPLVPFALPILIFMLLVPMQGVAPLVDPHEIGWFIGACALAIAVMTALAVFLESPIQEQLPSWMRNTILIVGVGAFAFVAGEVVRDTHARHVAGVERLVDSNTALRSSRSRLVGVADAERRRLERDLHDGAQQRLTALTIRLRLLAAKHPDAADGVDELIDEVQLAIDDLRAVAHGLYPPLLERRGLGEALGATARRSPIDVVVNADGIGRYDESVETAVYFSCLEAITNATKYAGADATVTIDLTEAEEHLQVQIADDGPGFDPEVVGEGSGLRNMTDRIAAVDADLRIDTSPGNGVRVTASIPVSTDGGAGTPTA
ncbi:sensor histidine kinase [Ilumatobacter coccineus]|nr:histidine kinase [Ilumatobacter coccineus]